MFYLFRSRLFIPKKLFRELMKRYCKELHGTLLDVGCGFSPYKKLTDYQRYIGVEYNSDLGPDVVATAIALPFAQDSFDSALCTEVIEHVVKPEQVISDIGRVLRPGGLLLLSAPMSWGLHYEPQDFYRFTKYGLIHLLNEQGFEILAVDRVGGIFAMVGARLVDVLCQMINDYLSFFPFYVRRGLAVGCVTLPLGLSFYALSCLFDRFDHRDAINWIVLAVKQGHPGSAPGR